jgi:hypothetical protein
MNFEEHERRITLAAMLDGDIGRAEWLAREACVHRDKAVREGVNEQIVKVWASIAAAAAEGALRLEQLKAEVDSSTMETESLGIVEDDDET